MNINLSTNQCNGYTWLDLLKSAIYWDESKRKVDTVRNYRSKEDSYWNRSGSWSACWSGSQWAIVRLTNFASQYQQSNSTSLLSRLWDNIMTIYLHCKFYELSWHSFFWMENPLYILSYAICLSLLHLSASSVKWISHSAFQTRKSGGGRCAIADRQLRHFSIWKTLWDDFGFRRSALYRLEHRICF